MPSIRFSIKTKENLKGLRHLGERLKKQKDMVAEVGHFGGKAHPFDTGGATIAGISLINQQGNSKIPARPYMVLALESPVFKKAWEKAVYGIAFGETTVGKSGQVRGVTISSELPKLGRILRDIMMGIIQTNPWMKGNSAATIAKKGFDHPLIETANLVNDLESRISKDVGRRRDRGLNKVAR
tara:strand:- start:15804 stop:16352 length:549 start_codon:yes stop_codon:yes gene_type:complete